MPSRMRARINKAESGEKYVTLESTGNNEVLLTSELYSSSEGAQEAVDRLAEAIPDLEVVDDTA